MAPTKRPIYTQKQERPLKSFFNLHSKAIVQGAPYQASAPTV